MYRYDVFLDKNLILDEKLQNPIDSYYFIDLCTWSKV